MRTKSNKTISTSSQSVITLIPLLLIIGLWCAAGTGIVAQNLSATDIVTKADKMMRGNSSYSEMEMKIIRPSWTRTLKFKAWAKGDDYSLVYVTYPAREAGQVFLKRKREMWNFVPSIDRMIKIPPSMMMQSWMGSDLTNDDLVNGASIVNDYDHRIVREETLRGRACYVIQLTPHEDAPVVWGKILAWITQEGFLTLRNEYYDEADILINEEILDDIKEIGDRTIPTRFTMIPVDKEGQKTIMTFTSLSFDTKIEETFFSIQNMKRLRK